MVAFSLGTLQNPFGGEVPRLAKRMLPIGGAQLAVNCDLISGPLKGLPELTLVKDFSYVSGPVKKAFRYITPGSPDVWLPLSDPNASVVRSPVTNDAYQRMWWTIPGQGLFWSTAPMVAAGTPPFNGGTYAPTSAPTVTTSGGTATNVDRGYLVSYIDSFGQESLPSPPSAVVAGPSDATWNVSLPVPPTVPSGKNLPPIVTTRIYRTVSSATQGAAFYQVADVASSTTLYADTIPDTIIVNQLELPSTGWSNPPALLDGLVAHPAGFLVGFVGTTVYFSEPGRPNIWPPAYDITVQYPIVGLAIWSQSVAVMTQGFPVTITGAVPASMMPTTLEVPEPCVSRGSIVADTLGVYYASPNGLIMLNYYGANNRTLAYLTAQNWQVDFQCANILAARNRTQYVAVVSGFGYFIDFMEQRLGLVRIPDVEQIENVFSDVSNGAVYMISNKKLYLWDDPNEVSSTYRWKSREFFFKIPVNFGALQINQNVYPDPGPVDDLQAAMPDGTTTDDVADNLALPDGQFTLLRVFADKNEVWWGFTNQPSMMVKLPSGFKSFLWEFEVVSKAEITSIEVAETGKELTTV